MSHALTHAEAESAVLSRMAASRAALLEANRVSLAASAARKPSGHSAATLVVALKDAPRVTLLMALCLSAIILGPRRTIGIASRSGVTALIGSSVRRLIRTTVSAE
jgi:hypothetical protein